MGTLPLPFTFIIVSVYVAENKLLLAVLVAEVPWRVWQTTVRDVTYQWCDRRGSDVIQRRWFITRSLSAYHVDWQGSASQWEDQWWYTTVLAKCAVDSLS